MTDFNAFFYSLVSTDTQEMYYADKRQQFLVDQGYSFQVIDQMPYSNDLKDPVKRENLPFKYAKRAEQTQLLTTICNRKDTSMDEEEGDVESDDAQQFIDD